LLAEEYNVETQQVVLSYTSVKAGFWQRLRIIEP